MENAAGPILPTSRLERLKKRPEFLTAQAGAKAGTPGFLMTRAHQPNQAGRVRVGFTVTKKVGKAVARNRIKRRLKEAAQQVFAAQSLASHDFVIIARPAAETRNFALLLDDMKRALLRLAAPPK